MDQLQLQEIIDACNACATACDRCAASCLEEDDVKMMARCIRLDIDCALICRLTASYAARASEFLEAICAQCAAICTQCASECASHTAAHCQACADACRRCEQACLSAGAAPASA